MLWSGKNTDIKNTVKFFWKLEHDLICLPAITKIKFTFTGPFQQATKWIAYICHRQGCQKILK